jgi:hypothetical protein
MRMPCELPTSDLIPAADLRPYRRQACHWTWEAFCWNTASDDMRAWYYSPGL